MAEWTLVAHYYYVATKEGLKRWKLRAQERGNVQGPQPMWRRCHYVVEKSNFTLDVVTPVFNLYFRFVSFLPKSFLFWRRQSKKIVVKISTTGGTGGGTGGR